MKKRVVTYVIIRIMISLVILNMGGAMLYRDYSEGKGWNPLLIGLMGLFLLGMMVNTIVFVNMWKESKASKIDKRILESIIKINDAILKIEKPEELFQLILTELVEIIPGAEMGSLMFLDENNRLEYKAVVGFDIEKCNSIPLRLEDSFLYHEGNGKIEHACIIREVDRFNRKIFDEATYQSMNEANFFLTRSAISAPIRIDGILYGMINVDSPKKNAFKESDLPVVEYFASQVGTMIRNHQMVDKMMYLYQYDRLTNVYSRSYFEELLGRQGKLMDGKLAYTIALFDLDNLKITNDTYGHQVGDRLIQNFAEVLQRSMGEGHLFARYGGDEFIAVFFTVNKEQVNCSILELVEKLKETPIFVEGQQLYIQFSYGTASFPEDSSEVEKVISIADTRMYCHKKAKSTTACAL